MAIRRHGTPWEILEGVPWHIEGMGPHGTVTKTLQKLILLFLVEHPVLTLTKGNLTGFY